MLNKSIIKELILNERNNLPSVLTPSDLIDLLPFGRSKIYEMIRTGEIPAKKVGGSIIIQRDIFLIWLYDIEEPESLEELKLN
ncbi:MAG: helix-turn-helix domain-containing protein [Candidatus Woesearchaeota archaeon]